ncbi:MAG: hypothetical protein BWY95_00186 [Bacteroidetes bacterium ADurb.BinA104]|nr:MAG: hypothetical protein BWY95_00186 [Bacteroidetes bacterium ADurb.BinA104]
MPTLDVATALREDLATYIREQNFRIGGRIVTIEHGFAFDDIPQTRMPCVLIGAVDITRDSDITHETAEFDAEIRLMLAVGCGIDKVAGLKSLEDLTFQLKKLLRNMNALACEEYGIFSHTCTFRDGEDGILASQSGIAKELITSISGSYTTTDGDEG